jgi:hypothetical protein
MCFTVREARPLLLVAESGNNRVQAVDVVDRAHAAFLFVGQVRGVHVQCKRTSIRVLRVGWRVNDLCVHVRIRVVVWL